MDADKIMIGDYFTVIESNPAEMAVQAKVVGIDRKISIEPYTVGMEHLYYDDQGKEWIGLFSCSIDRLQPIPLIPEVLERNDFKKTSNYQWIYQDNYCKVEIAIAPRITFKGEDLGDPPIILTIEGALFDINMSIEYVHQLQHALKLCGIEKEIIL